MLRDLRQWPPVPPGDVHGLGRTRRKQPVSVHWLPANLAAAVHDADVRMPLHDLRAGLHFNAVPHQQLRHCRVHDAHVPMHQAGHRADGRACRRLLLRRPGRWPRHHPLPTQAAVHHDAVRGHHLGPMLAHLQQ